MSETSITTTGELPDLDAMAAAGRERAKQVYGFKYLGREWHARTSVPFGRLVETIMGEVTLESALDAVVSYLVEDERDTFREAVLASPDVTPSELPMLSSFFNERAQEEVGNEGS